MTTYAEIQEQIKKLQEQAEELRKNEISGIVAEMKEKISLYNLTAKDLGFDVVSTSSKKEKIKKEVEAKYSNENGETWSGRGRQPVWLREALGAGKQLEDFLIESK